MNWGGLLFISMGKCCTLILKKYVKSIVLIKYKEFRAQFRLNTIDGRLRTYFPLKINIKPNNIFLLLRIFIRDIA